MNFLLTFSAQEKSPETAVLPAGPEPFSRFIMPLNLLSQVDHLDIAVWTPVVAHAAGHAFLPADMHRIGIGYLRREIGADRLAELAAFAAAAV